MPLVPQFVAIEHMLKHGMAPVDLSQDVVQLQCEFKAVNSFDTRSGMGTVIINKSEGTMQLQMSRLIGDTVDLNPTYLSLHMTPNDRPELAYQLPGLAHAVTFTLIEMVNRLELDVVLEQVRSVRKVEIEFSTPVPIPTAGSVAAFPAAARLAVRMLLQGRHSFTSPLSGLPTRALMTVLQCLVDCSQCEVAQEHDVWRGATITNHTPTTLQASTLQVLTNTATPVPAHVPRLRPGEQFTAWMALPAVTPAAGVISFPQRLKLAEPFPLFLEAVLVGPQVVVCPASGISGARHGALPFAGFHPETDSQQASETNMNTQRFLFGMSGRAQNIFNDDAHDEIEITTDFQKCALTLYRTDVEKRAVVHDCTFSISEQLDNPFQNAAVVSMVSPGSKEIEQIYLDAERLTAVHDRAAFCFQDPDLKFAIICSVRRHHPFRDSRFQEAIARLQGKINIRLSAPVLTWTPENIDRLPISTQAVAKTILQGQRQQVSPFRLLGPRPIRLVMEYLSSWAFCAIAPQDTVSRQLVITNQLGTRLQEDVMDITSKGIWESVSIRVPSLPPGESFTTNITFRPAERPLHAEPTALVSNTFGGVHPFVRTELRATRVILDHFTGVTINAPEKVYRRVATEKYWRCQTCGLNNVESSRKCKFCVGSMASVLPPAHQSGFVTESKITTSGFVPSDATVAAPGVWSRMGWPPERASSHTATGFQFWGGPRSAPLSTFSIAPFGSFQANQPAVTPPTDSGFRFSGAFQAPTTPTGSNAGTTASGFQFAPAPNPTGTASGFQFPAAATARPQFPDSERKP